MRKFNVKTILFSLALVLILTTGALTSCITFSTPSTTTSAAVTTTPVAEATPTAVNAVDPTWTPITSDSQITGQLYSIADVAAMVKPAVVSINTEVISYDFFNRPYTQQGAGSGWIIDSNGIIVTNNHVVEGAKSITVTLDSGKSYTADNNQVYTDAYNDLAIIKIDATGLPALKTGNAGKLRLGDWVVAVGNALGQGTRVTQGIVSRQDVSLPLDQNQTLYNLIETTAAINPGNSGGPLVNLSGEVIGITSAKIASVGVEGMGYAISINTALPIIETLVKDGFITRPYLGVSLYTVDSLAIQEFDLKIDKGVLVIDVSAGSPAAITGLKNGDVIVSLGGTEVSTVEELTTVVHNATIGKAIEIKYWRGGTETTTTITPAAAPRTQN
jgi:serine protease Do